MQRTTDSNANDESQITYDNGMWGGTETTLHIRIAPPFRKSGWAYLIYILLFVAVAWFLLHVLHRFAVLRNRIAVEKQLTEYKQDTGRDGLPPPLPNENMRIVRMKKRAAKR